MSDLVDCIARRLDRMEQGGALGWLVPFAGWMPFVWLPPDPPDVPGAPSPPEPAGGDRASAADAAGARDPRLR